MKRSIVFMIVLFFWSLTAHAVTEQSVLKIANSFQNAFRIKSVELVMSHLSEDWVMQKEYESEKDSYDYTEYRDFISKVFKIISNYQYSIVKYGEFSDLGDDTYSIKLTIKEMYLIGKKYIDETHEQTWYLREDDNGVKITEVIVHN